MEQTSVLVTPICSWANESAEVVTEANVLDEGWTFQLKDYKIDHQGENVVDMKIIYDYKDNIWLKDKYEYPEFTQIYKYIDNYLKTYPNEDDFREIVNKNLTETLLTKEIPTERGSIYKLREIITKLTIEIDVHPNEKLPYYRSSRVIRYVN